MPNGVQVIPGSRFAIPKELPCRLLMISPAPSPRVVGSPDAAEVYVDACEQNQPGFEVVVYLRPGECGLSASEARALARHLIAAADVVDDLVEMVEP